MFLAETTPSQPPRQLYHATITIALWTELLTMTAPTTVINSNSHNPVHGVVLANLTQYVTITSSKSHTFNGGMSLPKVVCNLPICHLRKPTVRIPRPNLNIRQ
jgi:hypothetical protein